MWILIHQYISIAWTDDGLWGCLCCCCGGCKVFSTNPISNCFDAALLIFEGWLPAAAFTEYWKYQLVMKPTIGVLEMKKMTEEIGKFMHDFVEPVYISSKIPR
jgi:hypothetical protein